MLTTTISPEATTETKKTPHLALKQIPTIDYADHPAYGKKFGSPSGASKIAALGRLIPQLIQQTMDAILGGGRGPGRKATVTAFDPAALSYLVQDGYVQIAANRRELEAIMEKARPYYQDLRTKREQIPAEKRTEADMFVTVTNKESAELAECVEDLLTKTGVLDAAKRYLGRKCEVPTVKLQITDTNDQWLKNADFGDHATPGAAMNHDIFYKGLRCVVYFNPVAKENGPFAYVRGSHKISLSLGERIVRKAIKKAGLEKLDAKTRELFAALPKSLQQKSSFGNDLLECTLHVNELLESEYQFIASNGHLIFFDGDGIHRDVPLQDGERIALQAFIEPIKES